MYFLHCCRCLARFSDDKHNAFGADVSFDVQILETFEERLGFGFSKIYWLSKV